MRKMIAGLALAMTMPLSLSACGDWPSPCEGLTVTLDDKDAAAKGYEVEKTDSMGNECELSQDGSSWSVDD